MDKDSFIDSPVMRSIPKIIRHIALGHHAYMRKSRLENSKPSGVQFHLQISHNMDQFLLLRHE